MGLFQRIVPADVGKEAKVLVGGMDFSIVVQGESGEVGIGHQFARSAHSVKAPGHVSEVVGASFELN